MKPFSNKIIAALTLTSFLMIAVFGFTIMMHMSDGQASGDCPFSPMGQSLCPQDVVAVAMHHISSYQSFLSVTVGANSITFLLSLLLVAFAAILILIRPALLSPPIFAYVSPDYLRSDLGAKKIARWLSLFENSPSPH